MSESFSLDGLRATPNALYYQHHTLQEEGNFILYDDGTCIEVFPDGEMIFAEPW